MQISTSTNICEYVLRNYSQPFFTCEESLSMIAKAGFPAVDFCFYSFGSHNGPLNGDDYQDWVLKQRALAERLGLTISQAHAVIYKWNDFDNLAWNEELMRRSIIGAGLLGAPWIVIHPGTIWKDGWYSHSASLETNIRYFSQLGELAAKCGVGIAIENMVEHRAGARTYCSAPEELCELVDALNDPIFGICWDTGHANMNKTAQAESLRYIGKRLKTLHINDNDGERDSHTAPYFGTTNWREVLQALDQIGYDGDFAFEAQRFTGVLPPEMIPAALVFLREMAETMVAFGRVV